MNFITMSGLSADCPVERWNFRNLNERSKILTLYDVDRVSQMFEVTGGASHLPFSRIYQLLAFQGFGVFTEHKGKLAFLIGSLGGEFDELLMPTKFTFSNVALKWSGSLNIKEDGVLCKHDSMYMGLLPILRPYNSLISENELTFRMALIASRTAFMATAGHDKDKLAVEQWLKDVEDGKLGAVLGQNVLNGIKTQPYGGQTGILTDLIEAIQYLKAAKLNEIGLDANYNMKRESIGASESNMNSDALMSLPMDIFNNIKTALDEVNEKYGELLDLGPYEIKFKGTWAEKEKSEELAVANLEAAIEQIEETGEPLNEETETEEEPETEESDEKEEKEDDEQRPSD